MKVVIRTYITNEKRFDLLKGTVQSAIERNLQLLGHIYVLDDVSPPEWAEKIKDYCDQVGVEYVYANGPCDTKNGFVESLRLADENEIIFCTVDDIKFAKGSYEYLSSVLNKDIKTLNEKNIPWACVGSFACYGSFPLFSNTQLFHFPTPLFYATVAHFFNPAFNKDMIADWDAVLRGEKAKPQCCDDLYLKQICLEKGWLIFNTEKDVAWHTGGGERSFEQSKSGDSSYYQTPRYMGD